MKQAIRKIGCSILLAAMCLISIGATESMTPVMLKAGMQNQAGGTLVLTETSAGMLQKGDLIFTVEGKEANILLEDVKVQAQGGIKAETAKITDGKNGNAKITIKRETKEAATIILSDFVFTVDRTVPEGSYDLSISGSAVSAYQTDEHDKIIIKDFIKVGTPNTEECAVSTLPRGTTSFTVDVAAYKVNNKTFEMSGSPYIHKEGYIMVPVRYVAKAFGVKEENILFGSGTITLFAGERTITLTSNSKDVTVNGAKITMEAPVAIKDGRTYLPASQLAQLLGLTCRWDESTRTANFINE